MAWHYSPAKQVQIGMTSIALYDHFANGIGQHKLDPINPIIVSDDTSFGGAYYGQTVYLLLNMNLTGAFARCSGGLADELSSEMQLGSVSAIRGTFAAAGLNWNVWVSATGALAVGESSGPGQGSSLQSGAVTATILFDSSRINGANNIRGDHGRRNESAPDNFTFIQYLTF